ncbi:MAG: bifunctional UDP-N-acetylmuramoyl-tripeptide:D-alanyl-D-alanine ligase/alanine racemase [Tannerella sp.]|jgi:alanine racemase|nr:bifunctional UDP-N-acetylmuramoyl-tripeptide:D-alanyl-D-alanine ligase/alanine racemase [Tannerella sp.]
MKYDIKEIASIICPKQVIRNDCLIDHLLTDSRTLSFPESTLFFAFKTRRNDGHRYISGLYRLRVRNFVVNSILPEYETMKDANFLIVVDVLKALHQLSVHHRKRFDVPVIGITGSNGKTIVKELLYQLLRREFAIVRSPRSYNSQLGVPLSVWQMDANHTLAIFEAGISKPNEMRELQRMIAPTIGIITHIGEAHQENFQSHTQKGLEKLTLFKDCDIVIYNADDRLICNLLDTAGLSRRAFGWSYKDPEAPLYVESIQYQENISIIRCMAMGIPYTYVVPFTDHATIENLIYGIAVILFLKPSVLKETHVFADLEPVAMRLEVKEGINNCQLINDTYNSDINSLDIALDFLQSRRGDKKIKTTVILSDILQSGMQPESLYQRVAELLKHKNVDHIIGIGHDLIENSKLFAIESRFFPDVDDFIRSSTLNGFQNELILLKGSRSFHFERITELLEKKVHETILEVNLDAIIHNYNYFRSLLHPGVKMICMVKANAYGAGAYEIAKTLQEHCCDYLAVAVADEGEELRKEGIAIPIMVMNPEFSSFNKLFENRLEPEVYNFRLLDALLKETIRRGITGFPIHVKIDTGMHRLGFQPDEIPELCKRLRRQTGLHVLSVFSHPVGSDSPEHDEFTLKQIQYFTQSVSELETGLGYPVISHFLNSAGIERFPGYQFDMVRLGIALYGIGVQDASTHLLPVGSLKTTILQIQHVNAGDSIGYGRMSYAGRNLRIAILPIGYADGLNRRRSNGLGEVVIDGQRCPIMGNICMDTCMVDITDTHAKEGDTAIIFGKDLSVVEIAQKSGTIPYEILTSVSPRVKRIYFRE